MLTVKVVKPSSDEDLYEAETVHWEGNALLMRGDNFHRGLEILGPQGHTMALDWDRVADKNKPKSDPFEGDKKNYAAVYVMNSKGTTIATYSL